MRFNSASISTKVNIFFLLYADCWVVLKITSYLIKIFGKQFVVIINWTTKIYNFKIIVLQIFSVTNLEWFWVNTLWSGFFWYKGWTWDVVRFKLGFELTRLGSSIETDRRWGDALAEIISLGFTIGLWSITECDFWW